MHHCSVDDLDEYRKAIYFSLSNTQQSTKTMKINPCMKLNDKVTTWSQKPKTVFSSRNHDDNVGDDGLSAQSTYPINILDSNYVACLTPNEDMLKKTVAFSLTLEKIHSFFLMALNEVRSLITSKMTLSSSSPQGKIINTTIAQIDASKVVTECDDIKFVEWTKTSKHAFFWYSEDIAKSEILQRSITKAIKKSCPHDADLSYSNQPAINERHQFVGFVSSHTSNNTISGFCLDSFAVFHCDVNGNTIVTCLVTARHHIHSNMQDHLVQLIQLNQKMIGITGLLILINSHIGGDISLQPWSQKAYEAMGFETETLTQDWEVMGISRFGIEAHNIIPLVWYGDSYSWAKFEHHILHFSFSQETKMGLERGFRNCLLSFLRTDLDGLLGFQLNPDLAAQLRDCVNQQISTNTLESDRPQVFTRFMQGNNSMHDIENNEFFTKLHTIVNPLRGSRHLLCVLLRTYHLKDY
jgi:hypothetical protein